MESVKRTERFWERSGKSQPEPHIIYCVRVSRDLIAQYMMSGPVWEFPILSQDFFSLNQVYVHPSSIGKPVLPLSNKILLTFVEVP